MTSLAYRTTTELLHMLDAGEVGSLELLDFLLARIGSRNAEINAVVALDAETARARARDADTARARGDSWGPLHGLPMTVKDSIEVVGSPAPRGPRSSPTTCRRATPTPSSACSTPAP